MWEIFLSNTQYRLLNSVVNGLGGGNFTGISYRPSQEWMNTIETGNKYLLYNML